MTLPILISWILIPIIVLTCWWPLCVIISGLVLGAIIFRPSYDMHDDMPPLYGIALLTIWHSISLGSVARGALSKLPPKSE